MSCHARWPKPTWILYSSSGSFLYSAKNIVVVLCLLVKTKMSQTQHSLQPKAEKLVTIFPFPFEAH